MGKLLHKLMHGIVPSWLTKIKASDASPKRLLPFFRRGTHIFSNRSSSLNTEVLALMDKDGNSYYSEIEDEKEAPAKENTMESSATPTPSSSTTTIKDTHHGDDPHHEGHHHQQHQDEQRPHGQSLPTSKRKRQCLQEEGEEDHGGSSMRWPFKRRKREKGVMSSELPECICEMVGNGSAVVKYSEDPHLAFWESMVEMIVGNGLSDLGNLEYLLYCYLSLNDPILHDTIQITFLQVLKDLERTS